jgi:Rps23 Pro-64 3,4-dihydroxylase Tpa1-like proline 4-hydroxylase
MASGASEFALAPDIDVAALRDTFDRTGRVRIAPFLAPEDADRLLAHLRSREDWQLVVRTAQREFEFDSTARQALGRARLDAVTGLAAPAESGDFTYVYERIVASNSADGPFETETLLGRFAAFLTSPLVLELLRAVTGAAAADFLDAQATRYDAGHFLTIHHDKREGSRRLAAYVFGLTQSWRPEWGGLLLFHDPAGEVTHGLVPRMNAVNLFSVPQDHSVSLVAPSVPSPRYSVTGWLRQFADADS